MTNMDPHDRSQSRQTKGTASGQTPPVGSSDDGTSTKAQDRGREVAGHARSEIEEHAETLSERTGEVMETTQAEVRDVVDEARDAVREQADQQTHVAAEALGRLRDDLRSMTDGGAPRQETAKYVQRAAESLDDFVDRLEHDGVEGALSSARQFARRSPGGFLLASAGAGFAIGRILRNADHPQQVDEASSDHSSGGGEIDLTDDGRRRESDARVEAGLTGHRGAS